jgi:hypothetical protein
MKKYLSLLLLAALLPAAKDPAVRIPSGLMVEFLRDPGNTKILDLKPEFTWVVPASAGKQNAYQILVASSPEKIKSGNADVWNSGKVICSTSSEIEYGGTLLPDTIYCWKVRIWDSRNKPTKYSEAQSFRTGDPKVYSTTANRFLSTMDKPQKLIKDSDGHYFADFGKDAFGTLILELAPEQPDSIEIHLGEKCAGKYSIDRNPGGSIRYQRVKLQLTPGKNKYLLTLPPDARNTRGAAVHIPDSFGVVTPFRYCEIENLKGDLKPESVTRKTFHYYFAENESEFTSSDTILNRIWDICKYSMKATSFTGIYIDGDRERIPYEADAYINQVGHYYTDREYSMGRITSEYFIKHPTWPTEWILHTVLMFYNDFMFTGNIESLKANYDALRHKTLNSLADGDRLISSKRITDEIMKDLGFANPKERIRDIVDWPPAQKDTGWKLATSDGERDGYDMAEINTVVNAFYYRNLVLMSEIAGFLGKEKDSVYFHNEAEKTRNSFNGNLLDKTKGIYVDGLNSGHSSLHANMMALAFNLVPETCKKSVIEFIKSRGMACSVYGSQYLLEGLYRAGEADYAYSLLTATNDRSWWNMIRSGSTITMEAWDLKYKPNSDWNHAWGAAPANIIPGYLWGIVPAEPGFAKAVIRPQLSSLKQSRIKVPTIRGTIIAEYKNTGKTQEYLITLPGNMSCDLFIPGEKVSELKPGLNRIVINESTEKLYYADVIVYGGTSAAVTTAVQVARMGKSVIIVSPDKHLGGMSSSGLGFTDTGNKEVIGGLAREFYQLIWQYYQEPGSWKWQKQSEYGNKGQGNPAIDGEKRTMWIFEPHAAEEAFEKMISVNRIPVYREEWLDRETGVLKNGTRIISIRTLSGKIFRGKIFVDATYEGDLMAAAGVKYTVGREANSVYNESWNGVQKEVFHHGHYFKDPVSAYKIPGNPSSGLLPRISSEMPGENGTGDKKIQAYCYRLCLTQLPENKVPITRPAGYDSTQYELLVRISETRWNEFFGKYDPVPNLKTDVNNHGPFSFDNIGKNWDYPEASYERRNEILKEHILYQKGLLYFMATDKRLPASVRETMNKWGFTKDEFTDNGNWPYNIYVREARRMEGKYVMTENDVLGSRNVPEPIGMGSYTMDSHNVQRYVTPEGNVQNEGDIGVTPVHPYQIDLGSIIPKEEDCTNLLVPVCVSSSHIAFGSIRMEPVFMILGQSAGTIAAMAADKYRELPEIKYNDLKPLLLKYGQILEYNNSK